MTIDERLEKLVERHEALTQTVEIVAGMQKVNEEAIGKLGKRIESLLHIAEIHQQRLDDLEGK